MGYWWSRRYLVHGVVAHYVHANTFSRCGRFEYEDDWLGGGSYEEQRRAKKMPLCKQCAKKEKEDTHG